MATRTPSGTPSLRRRAPLVLLLSLMIPVAAFTMYFVHRSSLQDEAKPVRASQPEVDPGGGNSARRIYPNAVNPHQADAAGTVQTSREHKRLLLDFGGDGCADCLVLDFYLHQPPNAELLRDHFIVVHVYVGERIDQNLDIPATYHVPVNKGVSALAVLDGEGNVLFSQTAEEFGPMRMMDPSSVIEFPTRWKA